MGADQQIGLFDHHVLEIGALKGNYVSGYRAKKLNSLAHALQEAIACWGQSLSNQYKISPGISGVSNLHMSLLCCEIAEVIQGMISNSYLNMDQISRRIITVSISERIHFCDNSLEIFVGAGLIKTVRSLDCRESDKIYFTNELWKTIYPILDRHFEYE